MAKQTTIAAEISLKGVGLHTGQEVAMTFKPAPVNNGFTFVRVDLEGQPIIEADADLVVDTSRGTTLEKNGVRVHTTEHVLAALMGLEIDNCLIQIDGPEMPIMDGCTLTRKLKGDPRFKNIPIIMYSSLTSEENARRGIDAGVNIYVKKFDSASLSNAIGQLLTHA